MTRLTIDDMRKLAAKVYDQDELSSADVVFLAAVERAKQEYSEVMVHARNLFGPGTEAFEATKRLASRREMDRYAEALHALETADEIEDMELQQAAE